MPMPKSKYLFALLIIASAECKALVLKEMYPMSQNDRAWYLGGIYDSNIIDYRKDGLRSKCLEKMGFEGFAKLMSAFVTALPQDSTSKERITYDNLNVALIAALEIDKACSASAEAPNKSSQPTR